MLFAARIVDGLSGGNITTARAYIADITTEENRAKSFGMLGAAFGLGFIVGPALGALFSHISYTAPIWAAAAITVVATVLAWVWLPETVHRATPAAGRRGARCASWAAAPSLRLLFTVDFVYWTAFAVYQTTFALFGAQRFGFDAAQTGYLLSAFGFLGVLVQGVLVGRVVTRLGAKRTLAAGLLFAAVGWGGSAMTHSLPFFVAMLVPGAIGIGLCNATLSTLDQQRRRAARAGPRPGRRRRAREPRPDDRSGVGQRRAAGVRRRQGVRIRGHRAARRRRDHLRYRSPRQTGDSGLGTGPGSGASRTAGIGQALLGNFVARSRLRTIRRRRRTTQSRLRLRMPVPVPSPDPESQVRGVRSPAPAG